MSSLSPLDVPGLVVLVVPSSVKPVYLRQPFKPLSKGIWSFLEKKKKKCSKSECLSPVGKAVKQSVGLTLISVLGRHPWAKKFVVFIAATCSPLVLGYRTSMRFMLP